jgi:hypothetical protein
LVDVANRTGETNKDGILKVTGRRTAKFCSIFYNVHQGRNWGGSRDPDPLSSRNFQKWKHFSGEYSLLTINCVK